MKPLSHYMNLNYRVEILKNEEGEGYVLQCPELKGCVTFADTIQNGLEMIEDAKACWITACLDDGIPVPEPSNNNEYSGQFKLRLPKSLHKTLADRSRQEGISMNQYCLYLLAAAIPRTPANSVD
jgi:predicted RNase H-like HicB family nuclease